jgi:DNA-directed RNA polymerase specialized sigma24 family protein
MSSRRPPSTTSTVPSGTACTRGRCATAVDGARGPKDVTHDVFLQLHRNLRQLELQDVGAWLYRVTANLALGRFALEVERAAATLGCTP